MGFKKPAATSLLLIMSLLLATLLIPGVRSIGVCYGTNGNNLPSRQDVINLYKSRNIGAMRLYYPDREALQALRGTNIELILDIPKDQLESIGSNAGTASQWVQDNVRNYSPDVRFKYIAVGNEVEPGELAARFVLPAMRNIQTALSSSGLQIKVSTAVKSSLVIGYPPADGVFRNDIRSYIDPIINFLASNRSPLLANIYPYFSYIGNPSQITLPYALFTATGTVIDTTSGLQYQNLFDALVDTMYAALSKSGGSNIPIVVSESGWPSAGSNVATAENAATYYRNLIRHVQSGRGTPRKPQPLETYIFAMFDEDMKKGDEVERHFGIFHRDGAPKYNGVP